MIYFQFYTLYLSTLVFVIFFQNLNAQNSEYKVLRTEVVETGDFGDKVRRTLTASQEGSEFRFIHPVIGNATWHLDSLLNFIISEHKLDKQSLDFDIVFAAADFIKRKGIESHIGDIEWFLPSFNNDLESQNEFNISTIKHPLSFHSVPSKTCGEFNHQLHNLVSLIVKKIETPRIRIRGVALPGHETNEYWDKQLKKWVYLDVDPMSEVFIPRKNGQLVSVKELVNDNSILEDTSSFFHKVHFGQNDSLSMLYSTENTRRYLSSMEDIYFYPFKPINKIYYLNDIFYRLPPNQELIWDYFIKTLFLEGYMLSNNCAGSLFIKLMDFFSNDKLMKNLDSTQIINHALNITGKIAQCYDIDSLIISQTILQERLNFCDSTFFGVDIFKEHTFHIVLSPGEYSTESIYIPNLIKKVEGGSIEFKDGKIVENDFYWIEKDSDYNEEVGDYVGTSRLYTLTQDFFLSKETKITFLGNYKIQLVQDIALYRGGLTVENFINNKLK